MGSIGQLLRLNQSRLPARASGLGGFRGLRCAARSSLARRFWKACEKSLMSARLSIALLALGTSPTSQGAEAPGDSAFVVPFGLDQTFGGSTGGLFLGGEQVQQIYGAALFDPGPTDVFEITGVAFRLDETEGSGFDIRMAHITIDLDVLKSPETMYMNWLKNAVRVYSAGSLAFPALANRAPSDFDIPFAFQKPYIYDRRKGALILQASISGAGIYTTDGEFSALSDGYFLFYSPLGYTQVLKTVLVTRFSGRFHTVITGISGSTNSLQIDFESPGQTGLRLEAASAVGGPYAVDPMAQFSTIGTNRGRVVVPIPTQNRFWRLLQE